MARLISTDGNERNIEPTNGTDFTLEEMYAALGCDMIEIVYLLDDRIMVIDEEGKLTDKPENALATMLATDDLGIRPYDYIAGTALICADGEVR